MNAEVKTKQKEMLVIENNNHWWGIVDNKLIRMVMDQHETLQPAFGAEWLTVVEVHRVSFTDLRMQTAKLTFNDGESMIVAKTDFDGLMQDFMDYGARFLVEPNGRCTPDINALSEFIKMPSDTLH